MGSAPVLSLDSFVFLLLVLTIQVKSYHRLTRANTPASAPLRRFLPFSPWRAPARLRIKSQKSLGNPSLAGAKQFCRAEMCSGKERPAGNTCRISKGLDAVWAHFCPSKPCLPLSIDGMVSYYYTAIIKYVNKKLKTNVRLFLFMIPYKICPCLLFVIRIKEFTKK